MESVLSTTMSATVCEVCPCHLLVRDHSTNQCVHVNTPCACCWNVGDCVCIHFNGVMTNSIPPQITATCVEPCC